MFPKKTIEEKIKDKKIASMVVARQAKAVKKIKRNAIASMGISKAAKTVRVAKAKRPRDAELKAELNKSNKELKALQKADKNFELMRKAVSKLRGTFA